MSNDEPYDVVADLAICLAAMLFDTPHGLRDADGDALARLRENLNLELPVTPGIVAAAIRVALTRQEEQAGGLAAELGAAWEQVREDRARGTISPDQRHAERRQLLTRAVALTPAGKAVLPGDMQAMLWNFQIAETGDRT
jgi:hypothetical protein